MLFPVFINKFGILSFWRVFQPAVVDIRGVFNFFIFYLCVCIPLKIWNLIGYFQSSKCFFEAVNVCMKLSIVVASRITPTLCYKGPIFMLFVFIVRKILISVEISQVQKNPENNRNYSSPTSGPFLCRIFCEIVHQQFGFNRWCRRKGEKISIQPLKSRPPAS